MVKVQFPNGYITELREPLAVIMCNRGECKRVDGAPSGDPALMSGDSMGRGRPSPRPPRVRKDKE